MAPARRGASTEEPSRGRYAVETEPAAGSRHSPIAADAGEHRDKFRSLYRRRTCGYDPLAPIRLRRPRSTTYDLVGRGVGRPSLAPSGWSCQVRNHTRTNILPQRSSSNGLTSVRPSPTTNLPTFQPLFYSFLSLLLLVFST